MDIEKITTYLCDNASISSDDIQKIENNRLNNSDFCSSYDELETAMLIADVAIYDKCGEAQQSVWNRIEQKIGEKKEVYHIGKKKLYGCIAAAVVVFAMFTVGLSYLLNHREDSCPRMMSVAASEVGNITTRLFDGTVVTINSNSMMKYSSEFNRGNRDVFLLGEAWFDVAKNYKPFVVYSNNISVTALGTSFNVRSHGGVTEVTLSSGIVVVANATTNDSLTTLRPGQKAIIDSNMNVKVEKCDALSEGIWRDDSLEFEGKSLDEIVKTLEKWHGITIINNIKPNGKTYWMKMTEKRITTTLEVFKNLENINYKIIGDTIVLSDR